MSQRTSPKGRLFIEREEGVRRFAYNDSENHATFGIGHLLHLGPVTRADKLIWGTPAHPRPMAFVRALFRKDIRKYENAVRRAVGRTVNQHQFDAMVSLCLNIGVNGFARSTVARMSRERRRVSAADAFLMWTNPSVLRKRRERERRLFLTGRYTEKILTGQYTEETTH